MVGAGSTVFAVMGYVIAKQEPDRQVGSQVTLNPVLLKAILGDELEAVEKAIEFLCAPDPQSNSPDKDGRRLVKIGQFAYQVVNGAKYRAIRDEETRREQNREAKRRQRSKTPKVGTTAIERVQEKAEKAGDTATVQRIEEMKAGVQPGTFSERPVEPDDAPAFPEDEADDETAESL